MTVHPTIAVAPPKLDGFFNPSSEIVAWYDVDGPGAAFRAKALADVLAARGLGPVFVVRRHAEGAHVLSCGKLSTTDYRELAWRHGADAKAADIAVERGQPWLRSSSRPYDDARPRVTVVWGWSTNAPGSEQCRPDTRVLAAIGLYLSQLHAVDVVSYLQERDRDITEEA